MNLHFTYQDYITHQHTFANDYEGRVVTTLIESKRNQKEAYKSVLYIHGFCDYFFQKHIMEYFNSVGINFYALDLRKCGRSLLTHQHPNYCQSLDEYFPDIEFGLDFILNDTKETQIYLLGHSTGGLLATYYAKFGKKRERLRGLILNSPFLDFNIPFYVKPFVSFFAKNRKNSNPFGCIDGLPEIYGESLHKDYKGNWDYDKRLKPIKPFPVFYAWILAVKQAQDRLVKSSDLGELPILLLYSSKSGNPKKWNETVFESDIVLNVNDIKRVGNRLSNVVVDACVDNGIHDLFLSKDEVIKKVQSKVREFLLKY